MANEMPRPAGRTIGPVATGILVLALLFVAQSIFAPLVFSLFIIALVLPCQTALERRLPKLLALMVTLLVTIAVIVTVGSSLAWGFSKLGQWLFINAERFQNIYMGWTDWLEEHGVAIAGPLIEQFNVSWLLGIVRTMAARLHSLGGFLLLVLIFVMLGLLEVADFRKRLLSPSAQPYGQLIFTCNRRLASKMRRYMMVRTLASIFTGLAVWLFALGSGLELAAAWGAIAFALNYIPFLGPLFATTLPTLFAIAQYDSWVPALAIFSVLNVVQFVIGSYIEPRLTGASLDISPFAVIFAVFFWSFMWGVAGAFIGVPILIAFIVYCAGIPSMQWIAALLTDGGAMAATPKRSPSEVDAIS